MAKLTDKGLTGLKPRSARYEVWEGNGFGVRVSPRGTKSFVLVYHFEGRPRRMTLGTYPALTLAQARTAAAKAREDITKGIDPGTVKVQQAKDDRIAETVSELIDDYLRLHAPKKKSGKQDRRILEKDIRPRWGKRKAKVISRSDVTSLMDEIAARGAPIMANRTLAIIRRMFNFGIRRGVLEVNPCIQIEKPGEEKRRERRLEEDSLAAFWNGLDRFDCTEGVRIALRLCLVTMQRREEVAHITVGEINEGQSLWTIPSGRTKNSNPHAVPLSPLALDLVRQAKRLTLERINEIRRFEGQPPLTSLEPEHPLFISRLRKIQPIHPDALTRTMVRNCENILGFGLSPHDLRRTAYTLMGGERIRATRFIRERIANHVEKGVAQHYDLYDYLPEKREALNAWGEMLAELIPSTQLHLSDKVIPIAGANDAQQ